MHDSLPPEAVLVVDLDGTLIKSDLLYESFFDVAGRAPVTALRACVGLVEGKATLKAKLADAVRLDPAALPYHEETLALIREARDQGRRTVLASASDQRLVDLVAEHLGLFDEAIGTRGGRNLSGAAKAEALCARFGAKGFDYVGDAAVDMPVWAAARRVVTVGAPAAVRAAVDRRFQGARHLAPAPRGAPAAMAYLRALRPHQWLKNILVFLPVIAAHSADPALWLAAAAAFVAFSLTASSVYVVNDLLDLRPDRLHPRKRRRPFASGAARPAVGLLVAAVCAATGFAIAAATSALFLATLAVYFLATFAYSLRLKRRLVIDVCTLAGLYTLRVLGGAAAAGVAPSPWLLAFSVFLFLSLAAMKRMAELTDSARNGVTSAAGRAYHVEDRPIVATMAIAAGYNAVLVLALYVNSDAVARLYNEPLLLWGGCAVVLYWISRMAMLAHRGVMDDDPVVFAVTDRVSVLCGGVVAGLAVAATLI